MKNSTEFLFQNEKRDLKYCANFTVHGFIKMMKNSNNSFFFQKMKKTEVENVRTLE